MEESKTEEEPKRVVKTEAEEESSPDETKMEVEQHEAPPKTEKAQTEESQAEEKDEEEAFTLVEHEEAPKTATTPSGTAAASSLMDEIRIVNELVESSAAKTKPVPITVQEGPHPVKQALDRVGNVVKNVRGALDQHVAPRVQTIKTNTTRTVAAIGSSTKGAIDQHVTPHVENISKSTRAAYEEHVAPQMEAIKTNTQKSLTGLGETTKGVMDEHVAPHVEKVKTSTSKAVTEISSSTRDAYVEHVEPKVSSFMETAKTYAPYYMGTAPSFSTLVDGDMWQFLVLEGTMRAFGQVIFCNNPVTGGLVWLALLFAAPLASICALACVATVNLVALYMDMDRALLRKGVLSYNAVLVGSGIASSLAFSVFGGWLISIFVSVLAAPFTLLAYVYSTSLVSTPLLFPANVVLIFILLSALLWNGTSVSVVMVAPEPEEAIRVVLGLLRGMSQVFLIGGAFSGLLILLGMLPCSRIQAGAAMAGSLLGCLIGWFLWDTAYVNVGMGGFNSALTCTALAYHIICTPKSIAFLLIGIIWTLIVQSALSALYGILSIPISVMTLPFCLATLPLLTLDFTSFGSDFIQVVSLEQLSTPEEHLAALAPPADDVEEPADAGVTGDDAVPTEETPLIAK